MRPTVIVLIALAAFSGYANAGPFGLDMAMRLADLEKQTTLKQHAPSQYSTPSLPNGHPDFNDYRLLITPQHGLCKVTAWTPPITTSVYGSQLQEAYERLFTALTTKYGNGKRYDYLRSGSIWRDPKDWTMALRKQERTLVTYWTPKEIQLPDNIAAIKLEAVAIGTESGMINLGYEFKNSPECLAWLRAQKDSKL